VIQFLPNGRAPLLCLLFSLGLESLKRGSAIARAEVTSHREAGDDVEVANDVEGFLWDARPQPAVRPRAAVNIRRTTSGLFRDFSRQFLHFGAVSFSFHDR
jgi:hypothetical protein